MGQANDPALVPDPAGGFGGRQASRDRVLNEQRNQVAFGGPRLLADDDDETGRRHLPRQQGALDGLVIGDCEMSQPALEGQLGKPLRGDRAVI